MKDTYKATEEAQCWFKQKHGDRDSAVRASHDKKHLNVYRCPHCGSWHVGSKPKKR